MMQVCVNLLQKWQYTITYEPTRRLACYISKDDYMIVILYVIIGQESRASLRHCGKLMVIRANYTALLQNYPPIQLL